MSTPPQRAPLSAVAEDYVKVIWSAQEWSDRPVTTKLLATRLGVGPSTVSETIRRLADADLVTHEPYGSIGLTPLGRTHAVAMVRRHRLLETFLVEHLGYSWDEVHDEAEVLEHAVSDRFVDAVDERLGHPTRDPHGDPIPGPDGSVHLPEAVPAWDATAGSWIVVRISDADPQLLRHLASVGLVRDAQVVVPDGRSVAGVLELDLGDGRPPVQLGEAGASAIWVSRA